MQLYQVVDNLNNQVVHYGKLSRNQVHNQVAKEYQVAVSTNLRQTANSSRVKVHKAASLGNKVSNQVVHYR